MGRLVDLLIEPHCRDVRYLVVDRSPSHKEVALPMSAAALPLIDARQLPVALSPEEICDAATVGLLREPTRTVEARLHSRLHWNPYWRRDEPDPDMSLQRVTKMTGMPVRCGRKPGGTISDLVIDCTDWSVVLVVVQIAPTRQRTEALVPTEFIDCIDWHVPSAELRLDRDALIGEGTSRPQTLTAAGLSEIRRQFGLPRRRVGEGCA
ncbi:hypothetical protein [Microbaculum marinisediminis]